MSKELLNQFGQFLMQNVRDETISEWDMILNGTMKGDDANKVREILKPLSKENVLLIERILPEIIDSVLHNLLFSIEQEEDVDFSVETPTGIIKLSEESDGFAGELYSEDGWISKYSKERSM